jgi:hypothetical protein
MCSLADRDGRKEVRLALDRRRARALRQIGERADGAEIVGQRHDGAAMQDGRNGRKFFARAKLSHNALGRHVRDLDAEKVGKGRVEPRQVSDVFGLLGHGAPLAANAPG